MGAETLPWIDAAWLGTVADRVRDAADRWQLIVAEQLPSTVSKVFACADRDGHELILKIAPPETHPDREAAALRAWDGVGAPRLMDFSAELGALVM